MGACGDGFFGHAGLDPRSWAGPQRRCTSTYPSSFVRTGRCAEDDGVPATTVARSGHYRRAPWPPSSSSPCATSGASTRPTGRSSRASTSRSFYPGAKIGVIGANGVGQVVAAADHGGRGRRLHRRGPPHPRLHRRLPPPGAAARPGQGRPRQRGGRRRPRPRALLDRYNEVCEAMGDPDADFDKLLAEQARAPGQDRRRRRLGPRPHPRDRHGRAAPARRPTPTSPPSPAASAAGSRCAASCSPRPDLLLLDEPTNHLDAESVAWLERFLQDYAGTVVAVTHDRYFLDNVAGWILELDRGARHPVGGQLLVLARAEAARGWPARRRPTRPASARSTRELEWIRMAPRARQAKGKARLTAYEQLLAEAEARPTGQREARDRHPAGPAPRRRRGRGRGPHQGLRRPAAHRRPHVLAAARRHRRRHRPERRRQDDAVPHDHRRREARRRRR